MNQRTYRNFALVAERTDISPWLDVEQEWQRLQQELGKLQAKGVLTLERLPSATVDWRV